MNNQKNSFEKPPRHIWFDIPSPYHQYEKAKAIIIPAPFEGTVSWKTGTVNGPDAVHEASPNIELYDPDLDSEPYLCGIHGLAPLDIPEKAEDAVNKVFETVSLELKNDKTPVIVGGEHSLTSGSVRACLEKYPDLSVLQLDAHADLRDKYEGNKYSHACVMRRIADLGIDFVQAGIRSMSKEENDWLVHYNKKIISSRFILENPDWTKTVLAGLSDNIYLTFDVDVLDPAYMPSTGTPEPGGISYYHAVDLMLDILNSGKKVVGMDMMELAPVKCLHNANFLAAKLLYLMIGAFCK
jgi:N1-aminopropylagmatine ureohydrolase